MMVRNDVVISAASLDGMDVVIPEDQCFESSFTKINVLGAW